MHRPWLALAGATLAGVALAAITTRTADRDTDAL
jgi:hypothetical protein